MSGSEIRSQSQTTYPDYCQVNKNLCGKNATLSPLLPPINSIKSMVINNIPMNSADILARAQQKLPWFLRHLRQLVEVESPSEDPAAINRAQELTASWAAPLGARIKRHRQKKYGDVYELRFGSARSKQKPILILSHLDTVWPLGTLKSMPWREHDGKIYGPGTLDMKAGVVMALTAISILKEADLLRPITLLINSEEEIGSEVSRPHHRKACPRILRGLRSGARPGSRPQNCPQRRRPLRHPRHRHRRALRRRLRKRPLRHPRTHSPDRKDRHLYRPQTWDLP